MIRGFMTVVGAAYIVLALWCAIMPAQTAESVGYKLQPGSGQSEYFVLYGGVQMALGLAFLWPWFRPQDLSFVNALALCLIVHGTIVLFRTVSFGMYKGIGNTTLILAGVEWAIFLASVGVAVVSRKG